MLACHLDGQEASASSWHRRRVEFPTIVLVRPEVHDLAAPPFPRDVPWINVATLRMDKQLGRPVLVEFWDFCRPNSVRTLPYLRAWHERYESAGLGVIGVHSSRAAPSGAAVARLQVPYAVVADLEHEIWALYGNLGWPARCLWNQEGLLHDYHYGEGAYADTERAIQALLGVQGDPVAPLRPEDAPNARLAVQTPDFEGPYSGPYEAGGGWGVLRGAGFLA